MASGNCVQFLHNKDNFFSLGKDGLNSNLDLEKVKSLKSKLSNEFTSRGGYGEKEDKKGKQNFGNKI